MEQKQMIRHYLQQFRLGGIHPALDTFIAEAEAGAFGYREYTFRLLAAEAAHRAQNDLNKRLKEARLPLSCELEGYDHSFAGGLPKTRMNQLREMHWLDQVYNIILMGPSGKGYAKTMVM